MIMNYSMFDIPVIKEGTNFWMIRTKRGFFFDEFIRNGFIAIGWNYLSKDLLKAPRSSEMEATLKEQIKRIYEEKIPGTALNKCERFCFGIQPGDIAVIVGNNQVAFAYIGDYYEEKNEKYTIENEIETNKSIAEAHSKTEIFECPYIKRRKISIIRIKQSSDSISPYLQTAFARNMHSLSNLNEYADIILSSCFDTVIYGGKLNLTFQVKRKSDISVYDLTNLVLNASIIISNGNPKNVSVKTALHSPGDIVLQVINFAQDNLVLILICYVAVFGGKVGQYEFNSLLSIIKSLINYNYEKQKRDLELEKLSGEVKLLNEQVKREQLTNIEKERQLQIQNAENCVKPLVEASSNLDVRPSEQTVVDLTKVIKEINEKKETANN